MPDNTIMSLDDYIAKKNIKVVPRRTSDRLAAAAKQTNNRATSVGSCCSTDSRPVRKKKK